MASHPAEPPICHVQVRHHAERVWTSWECYLGKLLTKGHEAITLGFQVPSEKVLGVGARRVQIPSEEVQLEV